MRYEVKKVVTEWFRKRDFYNSCMIPFTHL